MTKYPFLFLAVLVTLVGVSRAASVSAMSIQTNTLNNAIYGYMYNQAVQATDPSVVSATCSLKPGFGDLPPGITLTTVGVGIASEGGKRVEAALTGRPTQYGTYTFSIICRDDNNADNWDSRAYALTVGIPVVEIATGPSAGTVGLPYTFTMQASGGNGNYSWTATSLPPGLTMDATGHISGIPTMAGTHFESIFTVVDQGSSEATMLMPFPINAYNFAITTTQLPVGIVGASYSYAMTATGGNAPHIWSAAGFPSGLSINSASGIISGTLPLVAGTFRPTITVTDHLGVTRSIEPTLTVNPAPTVVSEPTPTTTPVTAVPVVGTTEQPQTQTITAPVVQVPGTTPVAPTPTPLTGATPSTPAISVTPTPTVVAELGAIHLPVHGLIKLPDDGNPNTQEDTAVYYIGADGRRHAFPNGRVYNSWYSNFNGVTVVTPATMSRLMLGANVTYRPGNRMVKFTTDPKVYAVDQGGKLRWIKTEAVAIALYGALWNKKIDDLSDAFYTNYVFGTAIETTADFSPQASALAAPWISDNLR
ncbi:MAG: Ig domain-containing protein [Patescibacteria group bacterium]